MTTGTLTTQEWISTTSALTNLEEITVELNERVYNDIVESIEKHENLQKVTFIRMSIMDRRNIYKKINQNWNLISLHNTDTIDTNDTAYYIGILEALN